MSDPPGPTFDELLAHRVREIVREELAKSTAARFLSRAALATRLGVTERQVRTLRQRGCPARKVGKYVYYDVNEVDAWIARHPDR